MGEMRLTLTVPPDDYPVSIAEANLHLRLEGDEATTDKPLVRTMIKAATQSAQNFTARQFVTATYEMHLDSFRNEIILPRPPLQSVEEIRYIDEDEVEQVLDESVYEEDIFSTVGRVVLASGESWPVTSDQLNAVVVEFKAGYGDPGDVPEDIRAAIRLTLGHLYEHRETVLVGVTANELPQGAKSLLWSYRILDL